MEECLMKYRKVIATIIIILILLAFAYLLLTGVSLIRAIVIAAFVAEMICLILAALRLFFVGLRGNLTEKKVKDRLSAKLQYDGITNYEDTAVKFTPQSCEHYKKSRKILSDVYSEAAGKECLKFVDHYQTKWSNVLNKMFASIGVGIGMIATIIDIIKNSVVNAEVFNFTDWGKEFGSNLIGALGLTLNDSKAFIGLIAIYFLIILLDIIIWKLGDDGFYDKIIKEILEENGESLAAE